jgi:hypothetical protein
MSYGKDRTIIPVTITIAVSTTISAEVNLNGKRLIGIIMPTAWTLANLTMQALLDEPSALPKVPVFGNVVDGAGAAVVIAATPTASTYLAIADTSVFVGLGRIKIVAGAGQAADRTLKLVCIDA